MKIEYPPALVQATLAKVKNRKLEGFVPGTGPAHPQIMLIGEAPGRTEATTDVPFSGLSGRELMKQLAPIGLSRDQVYITSVVRMRPYSIRRVTDQKSGVVVEKRPNRTPTRSEVLAFAPLFDWELTTVAPQILVPLGNTSLQRLLGPEATIGDLHGQILHQPVQEADPHGTGYRMGNHPYWIVPMYHPAAVLYARRLEPEVQRDWTGFGNWLKQRT